jgi:type IV secretory pathway TrbD component
MDVNNAISQISEINRYLAKSELFYGYKPGIVMSVGIVAFIMAAVQTWLIVPASDMIFLIQWFIAGSVISIIIFGNILFNYLKSKSNFEIQQMSRVFLQFVPSLAAGFIITSVLFFLDNSAIKYLPGLWAILFSLGIFSMRPYLPRMVGYVALFYLIAGGIMLCLANYDLSFSPWCMGATFGTGHLFAALILKLNIERKT